MGDDYSGDVVTVDGVTYQIGDLPQTFYYEPNSSHSFEFENILSVSDVKRYVWKSTSGLSNARSGTITVTSDGNVTATYGIQYKVQFKALDVESDFTGTIVTIDSIDYGYNDLPASFWYDENSSHSFEFQYQLSVSSSKRYIWQSTTGLSSARSDTITITSNGSVNCLLYTSPSPRDRTRSRMPSSA